jgi:hypothetical protein
MYCWELMKLVGCYGRCSNTIHAAVEVLGYVHMYELLIWHSVQTDSYFLVCLNKEFSLFLVVGFSLFHALLCVRSEISIAFLLGPFSILIRFT